MGQRERERADEKSYDPRRPHARDRLGKFQENTDSLSLSLVERWFVESVLAGDTSHGDARRDTRLGARSPWTKADEIIYREWGNSTIGAIRGRCRCI